MRKKTWQEEAMEVCADRNIEIRNDDDLMEVFLDYCNPIGLIQKLQKENDELKSELEKSIEQNIKWEKYRNTGYLISNYGQVKNHKNRILKGTSCERGYRYVQICDGGVYKNKDIHHLVASCFLGEVAGKNHVNHINSLKHDNRVCNLEWVDPKENALHARVGFRNKSGEKSHWSKITDKQRFEIFDLLKEGKSTLKEIALKYGVDSTLIGHAKRNKIWVEAHTKWLARQRQRDRK